MNNPLVKQILGAIVLAVAVAAFSGVYGSFLHQTDEIEKPAFDIAAAGGSGGGDDTPKKASGPEPILDLLASADVEDGAKTAQKKCGACHSLENGGGHKVGPNLYGVLGSAKARHADFSYSDAMASFGGDWSYEELNLFLFKPKAHVPGTKMGFAGFKKTEDRVNVIAFLRTLNSDPVPLP